MTTSQTSIPPHATQRRRATLIAVAAAAAVVAAAAACPAGAQEPAPRPTDGGRFQTRSLAGAFVPTGDQRDVLKDGWLTGSQLAYRVHRNVGVVGSFAWAHSKDPSAWSAAGTPYRDEKVNVFQYDLGVEGRLPGALGVASWALTPFAAAGAGGGTYDYRGVDGVGAETDLVGHLGAGTELGPRGARWALRVEARDYVSASRGPRGELADRSARNDVALTAGMTLNLGGR